MATWRGYISLGSGKNGQSKVISARDTWKTMPDHESDGERTTAAEKSTARPSSDLTARMDLMLQAMQQMREEMKAGQEETALKLACSAKRDPYSFRRKGNENQFRFCEDVEDQFQSAVASI